jgi:hypothetical protein
LIGECDQLERVVVQRPESGDSENPLYLLNQWRLENTAEIRQATEKKMSGANICPVGHDVPQNPDFWDYLIKRQSLAT